MTEPYTKEELDKLYADVMEAGDPAVTVDFFRLRETSYIAFAAGRKFERQEIRNARKKFWWEAAPAIASGISIAVLAAALYGWL